MEKISGVLPTEYILKKKPAKNEKYIQNKTKYDERSKRWRLNHLEEHKQRCRDYHRNNIERNRNGQKDLRERHKALWMEVFIIPRGLNRCVKCGYDKCFNAIDFHHKDPGVKKHNLGNIIGKRITLERLEEFDQVIPLCSNCHRELHSQVYLGGDKNGNTQ